MYCWTTYYLMEGTAFLTYEEYEKFKAGQIIMEFYGRCEILEELGNEEEAMEELAKYTSKHIVYDNGVLITEYGIEYFTEEDEYFTKSDIEYIYQEQAEYQIKKGSFND